MLTIASIVAGLSIGGAYALVALLIVLTYRFVNVINFTQTAVGAFGACFALWLWNRDVNLVLALIAGMATSAVLSAIIGAAISRWFAGSSALIKTATTAVLFGVLYIAGSRVFPIETTFAVPSFLIYIAFSVFDLNITWGAVLSTCLAIFTAIAYTLVLSRTTLGVKLRAMAARPTTAELVGIAVPHLSVMVWAVSGALTALAFAAISSQVATNFPDMAVLLAPAFAAAIVGRLVSFPMTVAGGFLLGALEGYSSTIYELAIYRGVIPFAVVVVILIWRSRKDVWDS